MQIPAEVRERMRETPGGEATRKEGVFRDRVQGAYLMQPLAPPRSCRVCPYCARRSSSDRRR